MKRLKESTKASVWVQDILRHTSITYQTERDKDEARTAFNCGTSPKMMDQHYRNFVDDPERIAEFWALTPERVRSLRMQVELPRQSNFVWPSKKELALSVSRDPLTRIAKTLGISDVALRKRCISMGIDLPAIRRKRRLIPIK